MKRYLPLFTLIASLAAHADTFSVSSNDIAAGQPLKLAHVFNGFGCSGGNQSPQLQWHNPPPGTQSYAITAYDPDAPTGSGWWHWVVFNIPASVSALPTDAGNVAGSRLPAGAVQGRTDFGNAGYGGACPPVGHGAHHYRFTVHALKVEKLAIDPNASAAMAGFMINSQRLGSATLEAIYAR